jgi:uncharacterized membrane-anchored protein
MLPSFILVLMGTIDCVTTVIGITFRGAAELNPFLSGIVSNIPAFMILKLSATLCIACTYILANKILNQATDKTTKSFRYSSYGMKMTYVGLVLFLAIVLINNFSVLLA